MTGLGNDEYLLQVALQLKDEMSGKMAGALKELEDLKKKMEGLEKTNQRSAESLKSFATTAKVAFAGISAAAVASIKQFADFEYGIKKVQTISQKSFDEIKKSAEDLSLKYGTSVRQLTEGNYNLVSSMGDVAEASSIMETAIKLSKAGFTDYTSAMGSLVAIMNNYDVKSSDSLDVANKLMQVQNLGIITIDELSKSISRVAPVAASSKISFEHLAASIATITTSTTSPEETMTQIAGLLTQINKSGTKVNETFKMIAGESFREFLQNGGDLIDGLAQIKAYADSLNISLSDIFTEESATRGATALINNLDKLKNKYKEVKNATGTTDKALSILTVSTNESLEILKQNLQYAIRALGEGLNPKIKELTAALREINWKEKFSEENINSLISVGTNFAFAASGIIAFNTAISTLKTTVTNIGEWLLTPMEKIITSLAGLKLSVLGVLLNSTEVNGTEKDFLETNANGQTVLKKNPWEKAGKKFRLPFELPFDDTNVDGYLAALEGVDVKKKKAELKDLEEFVKNLNLDEIQVFSNPKVSQELLQQTISDITKLEEAVKKAKEANFSETDIKPMEDKLTLLKQQAKTIGENLEKVQKLEKYMQSFTGEQNKLDIKAELFNMQNLEKAEEQVNLIQGAIAEALDMGADKDMLQGLSTQLQEAKDKVEAIKESLRLEDFQKTMQEATSNLDLKLEIFGADEEQRMLEKIRLLESQVSKAVSEGLVDGARELGKEIKDLKDNYKKTYEIPKESKRQFDDSLRNMSQSVYQVADIVGGKFARVVSTTISSLTAFYNSLQMAAAANATASASKGVSDAVSAVGGATAAGATASSTGAASSLATANAYVAAALAAVSIGSAIFGGSDEKRKQKNAEQEKKYEENTNALRELGERLKETTQAMGDLVDNMIASIAKNPTLHRIASGESALSSMENALLNNRDFGSLSFLVKESKKKLFGSKSYSKNREMSESTLLSLLGYGSSTTVADMNLDELKHFSEQLSNLSESTIRSWAESLTSRKVGSIDMSSLEEYKNNVQEYINSIELLRKEQAELFRNTTLEAFEGINVLDEKELIAQYTEMFESMGIAAEDYKDTIQQIVDANQVMVTSMEDVRSTFVESLMSGSADFAGSMGSYFQKILKNAAMTVYDTLYSEVDNYFSDMFKKMSDKLVSMKESGKIDFTEFWAGMDFGKILEAQNIQSNYEILIDDLRKKLEAMGIGSSIIDSMLPTTALSEKISEIKSMLSTAMGSALDAKDFTSFEKSLGQSIYDSVKNSLIQAFSESEAYKRYIDKYFNTEEFEKQLESVSSPQQAFDMLQDYMNNLNSQLEAAGMGVDTTTSSNTDSSNNLGNSYYTEKAQNITINITQNFNDVNGDEAVRNITKTALKDGLAEINRQSQILGEM